MSDELKRMFPFWADGNQALHRLHETVKSSGLQILVDAVERSAGERG